MVRKKDTAGSPEVPRSKSSKTPRTKAPAIKELPESPNASFTVSSELQQKCLNVFRDALCPSREDAAILQDVKGLLYQRDFSAAFGNHEYLRVYASRWSPSRALAYLQIFKELEIHLCPRLDRSEHVGSEDELQMTFLGGGAGGELLAAGSWWSRLETKADLRFSPSLKLDLVDVADWGVVVDVLERRMTTPSTLSKYASQAKKDANVALVEKKNLQVEFRRMDLLDIGEPTVAELVQTTKLVTFMFTLNELYSTSMAKTQSLIRRLKEHMTPGSFLLVVDSPGSYSTVSINGNEKKYPMLWLLRYTIIGSPEIIDGSVNQGWQEIFSDDSRWFRLSQDLQYPIDLENMRYQAHLFQKVKKE